MLDLTQPQFVKHAIFHPFEGFEDLRWKKAGKLSYTFIIIFFLFLSMIAYDRWCGFQFRPLPDAMFSVVPYIMMSVVYFGAWVIGNWSVCTLLDGEGTMNGEAVKKGDHMLLTANFGELNVEGNLEFIYSHI